MERGAAAGSVRWTGIGVVLWYSCGESRRRPRTVTLDWYRGSYGILVQRGPAAVPVQCHVNLRSTGAGVVRWYLYYRNSSLSLCPRTVLAPLLLPFPPPRRLRRRPKARLPNAFWPPSAAIFFFSPPPAARFFFFVPGDPTTPRGVPLPLVSRLQKKISLWVHGECSADPQPEPPDGVEPRAGALVTGSSPRKSKGGYLGVGAEWEVPHQKHCHVFL